MTRIVTFISVLSLFLGIAGCKGQAVRDADQMGTNVQGARAGDKGDDLGDWNSAESQEQVRDEPLTEGGRDDFAIITVQLKAPYGEYLADSSGMSLYIFEADKGGELSECYEDCAEAWPPFILEGGTGVAGELRVPAQVDASILGTVARRDGSRQMTYNGLPLYYSQRDESPGDTEGQGVEGFGDKWYLIGPNGDDIDDVDEGALR